jgi:hypothetical protein
MLRRLVQRFTSRPAPSDDEIARELRDHLDLDAESLASSGNAPSSDARFAARQRFGNVSGVGEAVHDVWHWTWGTARAGRSARRPRADPRPSIQRCHRDDARDGDWRGRSDVQLL